MKIIGNELSVTIYVNDQDGNGVAIIDGHIDISTETQDEGYDHEWGYREVLVDIITTSEEDIISSMIELIEFEDGVEVTDELIKKIKNQLDSIINVDDIEDYDIQLDIVI